MSTRSNVLNSSPVSFFFAVCGATPWWGGLYLGKVLGVLVVQGAEKKGATTTRMVGVAGTYFFVAGAATTASSSLLLSASSHGVHEVSTNTSSSLSASLGLAGSVTSASSGLWWGCALSPVKGALAFLVLPVLCFPSCYPAPPSPLHLLALTVGFMTGIGVSCPGPDPCFALDGGCLAGRDCYCWFWWCQKEGTTLWCWLTVDYFSVSSCEVLGYRH